MITIDDIIKILMVHNSSAIPSVTKAYSLAEYAHRGTFRASGEPYITHPLHVALNLLQMEIYDEETICAALLHDVVEDTEITLEDIKNLLNPTVAELVDGVTNMRRMDYSTRAEEKDANTRKIINGLTKDVRIILIKLADRIHNMRTLEFKKPHKQRAKAVETMELYVPLALSIGAYKIKSELEDLSLKYLEPDYYKKIQDERDTLAIKEKAYLEEMREKLAAILQTKSIPNEILIRTKNICGLYRRIVRGYKIENIYDVFYLKILVNELDDCYRALAQVHKHTPPINGRFKDYIYSPRTNFYQSLHTTVSDKNGKLIKTKIRTFDMDKISAYGISAYWNLPEGKPEDEIPHHKTQEETQKTIREHLQFARKLIEIDESFTDNEEFVKEIKQELLAEHVYVYSYNGEIIELPAGSTALDFACQVYPDEIDRLTGIIVNDKEVPLDYPIKNNDRISIKTTGEINRENWESCVKTFIGKQKIKFLINRQN